MRKSRFTEEKIIGILKQAEAGMTVASLCRQHGMSTQRFTSGVASTAEWTCPRRVA